MNFIKSKKINPYLEDLSLENFFISELMPDAPGDFVKVYLYGRMLAENEEYLDAHKMAEQLGVSESAITQAWDYWENLGAIKKRYIDGEGRLDFAVEYINLKGLLYGDDEDEGSIVSPDQGSGADSKASLSAFGNDAIKDLLDKIEKLLVRPLSVNELQTIISWVEDLKAPPEVILMGVEYSMGKGKTNFRYISTVVEGWAEQGLLTKQDVQRYIEDYDQKYVRYRRVMQSLGLSRNATEEERRIIDTWFDEMGYKMDKVLEACNTTAGITNPNVKYVNAVLENWQKEAIKDNRNVNEKPKVSNAVLKEYYDYLREKADREAEERRQEVYTNLPEIKEMDENMRDIGIRLAKSLLGKNPAERESLNEQLGRLNEDRAILLVENDYDIDYMEPRYGCKICNDTGMAEMGGPCEACREQRRGEAEIWLRERENRAAE